MWLGIHQITIHRHSRAHAVAAEMPGAFENQRFRAWENFGLTFMSIVRSQEEEEEEEYKNNEKKHMNRLMTHQPHCDACVTCELFGDRISADFFLSTVANSNKFFVQVDN